MSATASNQRIQTNGTPVTILTGFLGAGKTTLLNHILSNQDGLKTAVLVNEFGEIGIDNDLVVSTSADMVELSNGCICCTINGELLEAVDRILKRPEPLDYLVVETTGLADPLPVAMTFLGSELRDQTRLDSIITLVDAENCNARVFESEVGRSQIIYGDILLLNKTDLVSTERVKELEESLRSIKKDARILHSVKGDVPLPLLMSVGLFESDRVATKADHDHDHHDHGHAHHDHGTTHDTPITTMARSRPPITTMLTISTSRAIPPCHSVAMDPSRSANFKTSSTINCPRAFFAQKASFGLTKVKSAMFFT